MTRSSSAGPRTDFDPLRPIDPSHALVPVTVRVNERRVSRGFLPKLKRVAARIPFAADLVQVWYCARDPATPAGAKALMMAALAYFVIPTDAIPDMIAGLGFTDDAAVLAAVLATVGRYLKPRHKEAARVWLEKLARDP
jgi:uncharacterized membrane protein YkvA (DUF1232 family)